MKILSIDTSSNICSVSILEDTTLIWEDHISDKLTHSENLMPMIKKSLENLNLSLSDIDLFACSKGPGSFTGIRIGVSTICAFRDYFNKPAIGISSLESLAYNILSEENSLVCSIIDAKNNNVYAGLFKYENSHYTLINNYISDNINNVLTMLNNYYNLPITFVGSGAELYSELLKSTFNNFSISVNNNSSSISVAKAANYKYYNCTSKEELSLSPLYLKKSSAESELDKKLIKG